MSDLKTEKLFKKALSATRTHGGKRRAFGKSFVEVEDIPYDSEKYITPDVIRRARKAGAKGKLKFVGVGMTSVVLTDEQGRCWKVGRDTSSTIRGMLADEAEYLQSASGSSAKKNIAKIYRYHPGPAVIERACVTGRPGRWSDGTMLQKLHFDTIAPAMQKRGWLRPEFKENSYIIDEKTGTPILVDAGFTQRTGNRLVEYIQDVLAGRRKTRESKEDLAFAVRMERGQYIPEDVADKLLEKLQTKTR